VTVEALACGTPVFATPVGATEEILGNLDRSLLAEGTDADALAKGIAALYRRLAAEPAVRERLARAGRALVLREYTWSRHCANLEGVLSEAIQSRSVARP
jgi:glycosyltransferase involved in cell wall biosynthesis